MPATIRNAFQMPAPVSITGRSSSITASFVTAIVPVIEPSDAEITEALQILGMNPRDVRCAFCGDPSTEWDHLRALVEKQKPTGYITEIRNLVPACGKCNQSKGNKHWKTWMLGKAPKSPATRKVPNLEQKIACLERYEVWGKVERLAIDKLIPKNLWDKFWQHWEGLQRDMKDAQRTAEEVKKALQVALKR